MLKGTIFVTTDLAVVQNNISTSKILVLNEPDPQFKAMTNCLIGSVLLPPYKTMMFYADGDMQSFYNEYTQYLYQYEPTMFISAIIRALYNGVNILIYTNKDELEMYFGILYQFMLNTYGISIGSNNTQYGFNPNYSAVLCNTLYMNDLFTFEEMMMNYPSGIQFESNVATKLIKESNINIPGCTFQDLCLYLYTYKEQVKQSNQILKPAIFVGK